MDGATFAEVQSYAGDLDVEILESEGAFTLMWHGRAITFDQTVQGRGSAIEWLEDLGDEEYE